MRKSSRTSTWSTVKIAFHKMIKDYTFVLFFYYLFIDLFDGNRFRTVKRIQELIILHFIHLHFIISVFLGYMQVWIIWSRPELVATFNQITQQSIIITIITLYNCQTEQYKGKLVMRLCNPPYYRTFSRHLNFVILRSFCNYDHLNFAVFSKTKFIFLTMIFTVPLN